VENYKLMWNFVLRYKMRGGSVFHLPCEGASPSKNST